MRLVEPPAGDPHFREELGRAPVEPHHLGRVRIRRTPTAPASRLQVGRGTAEGARIGHHGYRMRRIGSDPNRLRYSTLPEYPVEEPSAGPLTDAFRVFLYLLSRVMLA
ncbi:hypothetical protein GCM10010199_40530 [Dactylosporangium roseum]